MMKNSAVTVVIVIVLIALAFAAGKVLNDEHDKAYDSGRREILEDWSTTDLLDYVRARDGLSEILYYVCDRDRNAIIDYCCDYYDNEEILERLGVEVIPVPYS